MRMYWKYFKYVMKHKKNVFIECWKTGLYIHAFTHDLSKLRPSEFFPYARFFMSKDRANNYKTKTSDEDNIDFQSGWLLHQKRNKHHWNYWVSVTRKNEIVPLQMPHKYIRQMICDWAGKSRKFGDTPEQYYKNNESNFILHPLTILGIDVEFKMRKIK